MADWHAHARDRRWSCAPVPPDVLAFHRSLEGYAPTRLVDLPRIAQALGVARVVAKDESSRLGLPAFKALGASWAMHRALGEPDGRARWARGPVTFVTATDGNHGRAVARMARRLGHRARVVVPDGVSPAAVAAIEAEGAPVDAAGGSYDDAVAAAGRLAEAVGGLLLQDTAWPGYERVPAWIAEGYGTLFAEAEAQLAALGVAAPDVCLVPAGVGSLAQAAVRHWRSRRDPARTAVVTVEPVAAACVQASLRAGRRVSVATGVTSMAGLNCGTPSSLAWPVLAAGLDGAVAITDAEAADAGASLRAAGVDAGPCGAASLAGARALPPGGEAGGPADDARAAFSLGHEAVVLLLVTEGTAANPG